MDETDKEPSTPWTERILNELQALEISLPSPGIASADVDSYPDWVVSISKEILSVGMPTVGLKKGMALDARMVGAQAGSIYARFCRLDELFREPTPAEMTALEKLEQFMATRPEEERSAYHAACAAFDAFVGALQSEWPEKFRAILTRAFDSAICDSPEDAEAFTGAFHRALVAARKPAPESTAFKVYVQLWLHWKLVESFQSVPQPHRFLAVFIPASELGDRKRLEKLCQRHGLKLRKPGRPPNSKNSDTPPA
jgi:hypothetical protein